MKARANLLDQPTFTPNPCRHCLGAGCPECLTEDGRSLSPQQRGYDTDANIVVYGGEVGGGKGVTAGTKPGFRGWTKNPDFNGIILRRTTSEVRGSIWKSAILKFMPIIAPYLKLTDGTMQARGIGRAELRCSYCNHWNDVQSYHGDAFNYIVIDEATQWYEEWVRYLLTRVRASTPGLPRQLFLTCNPGGIGHEWMKRWIQPWIDPKFPKPARKYEIRWAVSVPGPDDKPIWTWFDEDGELFTADTPNAMSIQFIPSSRHDNQALMANDPNYEARIRAGADRVTIERLLNGNWNIAPPGGGLINEFKRDLHGSRTFVQRMGASNIREAVLLASRQGWKFTAGFDHGQGAGRECFSVIAYNDRLQEAWTILFWCNARTTNPTEDSRSILQQLDSIGLPPMLITGARGDVGNLGKGSITEGSAKSLNAEFASRLGFAIHLPQKEAGSIETGVAVINAALHNSRCFVDPSCMPLIHAIEQWDGGEADKDKIDCWRYPIRPVLEQWATGRKGGATFA
jgi:hypothetical protein